MIKRSFFGSGRPKLKYAVIDLRDKPSLIDIPLPARASIQVKGTFAKADELLIRLGERVRTGQRLRLTRNSEGHFVSPVTGTIKSISPQTGYLGEVYTSLAIEVSKDEWDDELSKSGKTGSFQHALSFFPSLPGEPRFGALLDFKPPLKTFVINGMDRDLLITTNQFAMSVGGEDFEQGMTILKKVTGAERLALLVPFHLASRIKSNGVEVKPMNPLYPHAFPKLVMRKVVGKEVPAGKECEDMGVGFIPAESVMALGNAFVKGRSPVHKILTVIRKDGSTVHARARIGTPVKDVLKALQIQAAHGDRVTFGGPMAGRPALTEDAPVLYDTDAIMVQDQKEIVKSSETHCINCGECVRVCPARMPVNMLIRFLENGIWEAAVNQCDLLSCVECGLCTYVCVARIPIFQHIMLGKHEFARIKSAGESHA